MYDLRRLRSLCAIAEHGSLTAAADALTFTQPAVSQHLAALEAEVGAALVTRSRGGAELTAAGRLLVDTPARRSTGSRWRRCRSRISSRTSSAASGLWATLLAHAARAARGRRPAADTARRRGHRPRGRPARRARGAAERRGRPGCCSGAGSELVPDVEERLLSRRRCTPWSAHPPARRGPDIELAGLRDDAGWQGHSVDVAGVDPELCRGAGSEPRIAFESDDPLATRGWSPRASPSASSRR